jgi:hypothetical protein
VCTLGIVGGAFSPPHRRYHSLREESEKGECMGVSRESEETAERLRRLTFECACGERMVIFGLNEDWYSEQRANFECGCGQTLTLTNRLKEEVFEFGRLVWGTFKIPDA